MEKVRNGTQVMTRLGNGHVRACDYKRSRYIIRIHQIGRYCDYYCDIESFKALRKYAIN